MLQNVQALVPVIKQQFRFRRGTIMGRTFPACKGGGRGHQQEHTKPAVRPETGSRYLFQSWTSSPPFCASEGSKFGSRRKRSLLAPRDGRALKPVTPLSTIFFFQLAASLPGQIPTEKELTEVKEEPDLFGWLILGLIGLTTHLFFGTGESWVSGAIPVTRLQSEAQAEKVTSHARPVTPETY